jgi:uncharacterized membrane protein
MVFRMSHPFPLTTDLDSPHASHASHARLAAMHRFLLERAFYPLALCTLLCFAFWFTRICFTWTLTYDFLVKNLFLAWVPYFFSLAAVAMHESAKAHATRPARWKLALVWCGWLVMLPNAPYIFTDLIHWRDRPRVMPWWFDLGLVLMFALAGCFAGIVSLKMMHNLVRRAAGRVTGWAFVTSVAILSGFGIYLGRFERWNSWDILTQPHHLVTRTLFKSLHPHLLDRTFGVTLMFGAMILVTYVMFVSMNAGRGGYTVTRTRVRTSGHATHQHGNEALAVHGPACHARRRGGDDDTQAGAEHLRSAGERAPALRAVAVRRRGRGPGRRRQATRRAEGQFAAAD